MLIASILLILVRGEVRPEAPRPPIMLSVPVRCSIGQTCFIQQYFDHSSGSIARDYRCGVMVYPGHDGTDIRVATVAEQRLGVDVIAAAPGVVSGLRDGMVDADVRTSGEDAVKGRECGNGVVIAHAGGWETQYCHMAKGSLTVRVGQMVEAGTVLGAIGESGAAAFPHLHFSVRANGRKVDPFAWDTPPGTCGTGHSLWSPAAAKALAYHSPELINLGFSNGRVDLAEVESGRAETARPTSWGRTMTAYVRAIGLAAGDTARLTLAAPDGSIIAAGDMPALRHDRAEQLLAAGASRAGGRWQDGTYRLVCVIFRAGRQALRAEASLTLP